MLSIRHAFITSHSAKLHGCITTVNHKLSYKRKPQKTPPPNSCAEKYKYVVFDYQCLWNMQTFQFHSVPVASFHFEYSFTSTPTLHFTFIYCITLSTALLKELTLFHYATLCPFAHYPSPFQRFLPPLFKERGQG